MKYAVQYFDGEDIVVDTSPISREEAVAIFNENIHKFRSKVLAGDDKAQIAFWEDVGDEEYPVYGVVNRNHIEYNASDYEVHNGMIMKVIRERQAFPEITV